jgi:hypothetical protein
MRVARIASPAARVIAHGAAGANECANEVATHRPTPEPSVILVGQSMLDCD